MNDPASPKSQRVGFADHPGISVLRILFPVLAKLAPTMAAKIALKIFLTPPRHKEPTWEAHFSALATRTTILAESQQIVVYSWGGSHKNILLCHAWGGRGTQLAKFIEPLVLAGYRVVAFDAPGHGRSSGKRTDMMEYSATIQALDQHFSGFDALIAHSFGAGNAVFAVSRFRLQTAKIVLIGCFSHGKWIIQRFGDILNIPSKIVANMCLSLERKYNGQLHWDKLDIVEMLQKCRIPALVVHDKDDREIPYEHAEKFRRIEQHIWFHDTRKLGHRRIIQNPLVIDRVVAFIKN